MKPGKEVLFLSRLIVERSKIIKNTGIIAKEVASSEIIGVVKGNGYGLGLKEFAGILKECGVTIFATATLDEALAIKDLSNDILLLNPVITSDDAERLVMNNIIATIASYDSAVMLNGVAEAMKKKVRAHIKVDTGFGRYGFLPDETDKISSIANFLSSIEISGIYTHLSDAFGKKEKHVVDQFELFMSIIEDLNRLNLNLGVKHIANSCGALRYDYLRLDAVRIGSAFLGRLPMKNKWALEKVGYLDGQIVNIKWLPKGHNVGYANVYKTKKAVKAAVVDTGYTDGFCVEKSKDTFRFRDVLRYGFNDFKKMFNGRIFVTAGNKRVPVLGRVGMNSFVIDVTQIECNVGGSCENGRKSPICRPRG